MTIKLLSLAMCPGLGLLSRTLCYGPRMLVYPITCNVAWCVKCCDVRPCVLVSSLLLAFVMSTLLSASYGGCDIADVKLFANE
jgi:hypothetical protein